jgi:Ca-activated chloride channel family protein
LWDCHTDDTTATTSLLWVYGVIESSAESALRDAVFLRDVGGCLSKAAARPVTWRLSLAACALLASTFCLTLLSRAQSESPGQANVPSPPATEKKRPHTLKQEVNLVLVNATVTDPYGRLVTGLEQDNFRILEDNIEQELVHFSSEDVPISIGVIFDMSGSMADKFEKSRLAAVQFFKTANPQDEFFLVNFNDRAQLASPFTESVEELQNRLMFTSAHGRTALFDGIYLGLSQMKAARNTKRALLIISDGGDNHSRYSEGDVRSFLKEADVQLYAIGIYEPQGYCPTPEECGGPSLLNEMTGMTGGRTFRVNDLNELPDVATKISMELRNQYVLGYKPGNRTHDGKWRKIKVRLRPPKGLPPLSVYAKYGYFAPGH